MHNNQSSAPFAHSFGYVSDQVSDHITRVTSMADLRPSITISSSQHPVITHINICSETQLYRELYIRQCEFTTDRKCSLCKNNTATHLMNLVVDRIRDDVIRANHLTCKDCLLDALERVNPHLPKPGCSDYHNNCCRCGSDLPDCKWRVHNNQRVLLCKECTTIQLHLHRSEYSSWFTIELRSIVDPRCCTQTYWYLDL